jgi:ribokinase
MPKVVSTASVIVDVALQVPALPVRGGDVLGRGLSSYAGGGFNLLAAAARYGARCVYAGLVGDGPNGSLVRAVLEQEGIEGLGELPSSASDTGTCFTFVEPDGERTFITIPGAEALLRDEHLARVILDDGDLVAVSGYDLAYPEAGLVLASWIEALPPTIRVAFDPGPLIRDIPANLFGMVVRRCDFLTLNRREALLLSQADELHLDLLDAVRRMVPQSASRVVVLRDGQAGCVVAGGELGSRTMEIAAPRVAAVDTTGAGDAHLGVLLASLADGSQLLDAVATANRAASLTVTRMGPATAPTRAELDAFANG